AVGQRAVTRGAEGMEQGLRSASEFEECAVAVGAAALGRPDNVARAVQRDFGGGIGAVAGPSGKIMQHGVSGGRACGAEKRRGAALQSGRLLSRSRLYSL